MRILGAVLAGGQSRRFGSDKALALFAGKPLIAHVVDALQPQVAAVATCGGAYEHLPVLADRPAPGLGPLGGIAGALHHAREKGFDAVLSVGCDMPWLPADLAGRLSAGKGAAYVRDYPIIGLWPASLSAALEAHLLSTTNRSMRAWAALIAARAIDFPPLPNINSPADLAALEKRR